MFILDLVQKNSSISSRNRDMVMYGEGTIFVLLYIKRKMEMSAIRGVGGRDA